MTLWGHDARHIARLEAAGVNELYLPGVALPPDIRLVSEMEQTAGSDLVIFVTPSKATREVAGALAKVPLAPGAILLQLTLPLFRYLFHQLSAIFIECTHHRRMGANRQFIQQLQA